MTKHTQHCLFIPLYGGSSNRITGTIVELSGLISQEQCLIRWIIWFMVKLDFDEILLRNFYFMNCAWTIFYFVIFYCNISSLFVVFSSHSDLLQHISVQ